MTDAERQDAWDRVADEMRGDLHAANDRNAIVALALIAAAGLGWQFSRFNKLNPAQGETHMTEPTVITATAAPCTIALWVAVNEVGECRTSIDSAADAVSELQDNYGYEAVRVVAMNVTLNLPTVETETVDITLPPETKSPAQVTVS
jgi:hypothetical protein